MEKYKNGKKVSLNMPHIQKNWQLNLSKSDFRDMLQSSVILRCALMGKEREKSDCSDSAVSGYLVISI